MFLHFRRSVGQHPESRWTLLDMGFLRVGLFSTLQKSPLALATASFVQNEPQLLALGGHRMLEALRDGGSSGHYVVDTANYRVASNLNSGNVSC